MERQRIVVAEPTEGYRRGLVDAIQRDGDIAVVGSTGAGEELLALVLAEAPDLVLMELNLEGIDGIEVLEQLRGQSLLHPPKIMVLTALLGDAVTHLISNLGVDYYLAKPCSTDRICRRIRQLTQVAEEEKLTSVELERDVSTILQSMGMPAHIQGYQYLRWAIISVVFDPELLRGITKILYPMVAKEHHSTAQRVERSIRHAINMAWLRGDMDVIDRYFGSTISSHRGKPTNSEFIAMIADHLRLQQKVY